MKHPTRERLDTDGEYRVKVIADNSGKFVGNGVSFDTIIDAQEYARSLAARWTLVRKWAVFTAYGERVGDVVEVRS